ncbi:MAG: SURF1 family protein [Gammaproteobacteria bacterium]
MQFRPGWPLTVVMVVLGVVFVQLGFWQLDRAAQKRAYWEAMQQDAAQPAAVWNGEDANLHEARQVRVTGTWQPELGFWLDNRSHGNKPGMQRIDFLQLGNGALLAVNRGWQAHRPDRSLPEQVPALPDVDVGLLGQVHFPEGQGFKLGDATQGALRLYLDLAAIDAQVPQAVMPMVLWQLSETSEGLVRAWPAPKPEEGMHLAYAVQWFGFAAALLALWAWVGWRRGQGHDS